MIYRIPHTATRPITEVRDTPPTLEEVLAWVGVEPGYLEMQEIYIKDELLTFRGQMWMDESGKLRPVREINPVATRIFHRSLQTAGFPVADYILGNVVFLTAPNLMT